MSWPAPLRRPVVIGSLVVLAMVGGAARAHAACGDDVCSADENTTSCAVDCPPCGVIAAGGGSVDDGDACFVAGGPAQFIRTVGDAGNDGDLRWTGTTAAATPSNFGAWQLYLAEAGQYRVEVYTDAAYAESTLASYQIVHAGTTTAAVVDQTAFDGWQALGDLAFAVGGQQQVRVDDNTGEGGTASAQLVLDTVRLTRLDGPAPGVDDDDVRTADATGGCATSRRGGASGLLVVFGCGLIRRRRRRRA